jgi:glycosyltransferase involved in cell wall biosynthesis
VIDGILEDRPLSLVYQMSDVFIMSSLGESPGLPLLESMACGVVPVVTDYSGPTDFCVNNVNAFTMQGVDFWPQMWNVKRKIVDPKTVASTLELAYTAWKEDKPKFHRMSQAAVASSRQYDWDTTAFKMKKSLEKLFDTDRMNKLNRVFRV